MKSSAAYLFAAVAFACYVEVSCAAIGDQWSLSGDMQIVSNPSPPIDPGTPGGGTGTWTYFHAGGNYAFTKPPVGYNPELPEDGIGWVNATANHIALIRFNVAANPVPPFGTGNDKTVFGIGEVGGHATTGASWTTDHAGTFLVEWLGYNGRHQETDGGQHAGRVTSLKMSGPSGDLDVHAIMGGPNTGIANAYSNSAVLMLAAGDTLRLIQEGGEWVGLDLMITEVPEPASVILVALAIAAVAVWKR